MSRYALIVGGIVHNVIEADAQFAADAAAQWGGVAVQTDGGNVGDSYAAGVFTPPVVALPAVPARVTRRQARQALLLAGLLGNVQPAIDAIADATQRGLAQIEWDDSQVFERNRPLLIMLAAAMGLGSDDLDNLFRQAATLP